MQRFVYLERRATVKFRLFLREGQAGIEEKGNFHWLDDHILQAIEQAVSRGRRNGLIPLDDGSRLFWRVRPASWLELVRSWCVRG